MGLHYGINPDVKETKRVMELSLVEKVNYRIKNSSSIRINLLKTEARELLNERQALLDRIAYLEMYVRKHAKDTDLAHSLRARDGRQTLDEE